MRDSAKFNIDESINQRDFDDELAIDSGNLQKLGLGNKFGILPGTNEAATDKARKRYA